MSRRSLPVLLAVGGCGSSLPPPDSSRTLIMRIGVTGSPAPECLAQTTIVNQLGVGQTARDKIPRHTYPQADGSRLTHDIYLPLDGCCNVPRDLRPPSSD